MDEHMTAPRDDLIRAVFRDDPLMPDGNTLVGYMAVFDTWTTINSWEGRFMERVGTKFFDKTLRERGAKVKILLNHGMDPTVGDKPLGKPQELRTSDGVGLWHATPLDPTSYNEDLKASLRSGAIDGQSFRFSVTQDEWVRRPKPSAHNPEGLPERTLLEGKLTEGGPVTFPAYEAATAGIRSRAMYQTWLATPPNQRRSVFRGSFALPIETRRKLRQVVVQAATVRAEGEDAASLALAIDAALDALDIALDNGDIEEAQALLTAAEVSADALLDLLGVVDNDANDDSTLGAGSTTPRAAGNTPKAPESRVGHHASVIDPQARTRVLELAGVDLK